MDDRPCPQLSYMRTVVGVGDAARRVARGRRPIAGVPAPWIRTTCRGGEVEALELEGGMT